MWYFAWMLGIGFAVLLSILNAMWLEAQEDRKTREREPPQGGDGSRQA